MIPGLPELVKLIYPICCQACSNTLTYGEKDICLSCLLTLPRTHFHRKRFNPLYNLLRGRVAVDGISSMYFFDKGLRVQHLLHSIKYKGCRELATTLGEWYGNELKENEAFRYADLIIPVPLHPTRYAVRGYNQSEAFGEGLSKSMGMQVNSSNLIRHTSSETQTRKTREGRWENVHSIFGVKDAAGFTGRSVVLVDDVITTGATLEACAQVLRGAGVASLQIATIACALRI